MALNSLYFWFIFPPIFAVYWGIPSKYNKARNIFLLLVSYLLYMCWNPAFALVLLGVSLITYFGGHLLGGAPSPSLRGRAGVGLCFLFYLFITILTLSIGVLDSGQFIYVSF